MLKSGSQRFDTCHYFRWPLAQCHTIMSICPGSLVDKSIAGFFLSSRKNRLDEVEPERLPQAKYQRWLTMGLLLIFWAVLHKKDAPVLNHILIQTFGVGKRIFADDWHCIFQRKTPIPHSFVWIIFLLKSICLSVFAAILFPACWNSPSISFVTTSTL